jgi:hypothetical protein
MQRRLEPNSDQDSQDTQGTPGRHGFFVDPEGEVRNENKEDRGDYIVREEEVTVSFYEEIVLDAGVLL